MIREFWEILKFVKLGGLRRAQCLCLSERFFIIIVVVVVIIVKTLTKRKENTLQKTIWAWLLNGTAINTQNIKAEGQKRQ